MLISKFNRMIRNRFLWGAFAVLISISFVGLFTADGGCEAVNEVEQIVGTVDNLSVTRNELQRSRFYTMLQLSLMLGRPFSGQTPEMEQEFEQMSWRRALVLKKAENLGLHATDREVMAYIEQEPMFSSGGVFQRRAYEQFAEGFLRRIGVTRHQYDDFIRDEIVMEKFMDTLAASVWISPQELERHLQTYTDVFTVQSTALTTNRLETTAVPELHELEAYYHENTNLFKRPAQLSVYYVSFPAADYLDQIAIAEEDVENYYTDNLWEFRRDRIDEARESDAFEPDFESAPDYRPFEEVADEIRRLLKERQALFAAMDAATEFVMKLVPGRGQEKGIPFLEAAAENQLNVEKTGPFSRERPPPEPADIDPDILMQHAGRLEDRPDEYFSDAVPGESAAYVLALRRRIPPGVPPMAEIIDEVRDAMVRGRRFAKLSEHAAEVRREMIDAMNEDPDLKFEAAAAAKGLATTSYEPFSLFNAPEALDHTDLLHAIAAGNAGEFTDPVAGEDGEKMLLAYVEQRESLDAMSRTMLRDQIREGLYRNRALQLFAEWQDDMLERLVKKQPEPLAEGDEDPRTDMGRRPVL